MANLISNSDLLNKYIAWNSGSEYVRIDENGYFVLDGIKKRLLGFDMGLTGFGAAKYYDAASLAVIHTELDYLMGLGVRVMAFNTIHYGWQEEDNYEPLLDLLYAHNMLVIPCLNYKWEENFTDLATLDFVTDFEDGTVTELLTVTMNKFLEYPNMVAFALENEIDLPLDGDTYTPHQATTFVSLLRDTAVTVLAANSIKNMPLITKWVASKGNATYINTQDETLKYTDIVTVDMYQNSAANVTTCLDKFKNMSHQQMWVMEFSDNSDTPTAGNVTKAMVDAVFADNASLCCLFLMNRTQAPTWAFFDSAGVWAGAEDLLEDNLPLWQVAI